jgi:DNA polymerase-3 subunit epsilon
MNSEKKWLGADLNWKNITLVAFDTETSGKYPLESEICEIAALKWRDGKIVDKYQQLIKPSQLMSEEVIKIHNITNEMVADKPSLFEVLPRFYEFIRDSFLVAHHAPFDLGFLAPELESMGYELPEMPVFCSSLLSRSLITESRNHKLQTLIALLGLHKGAAHRALDDTQACLELTLKCFERAGSDMSVFDLMKKQKRTIFWSDYSLKCINSDPKLQSLIPAIRNHQSVELVYAGGSRPGQARLIKPISIVRNPDGDFLVAYENDPQSKRYLLDKILDVKLQTKN